MAHVGHERVERVLTHLLCRQGTAPSVLITQRELAAALGLSQPVISHALRMLRDTGRLRRNVDRSWSVSETPVYDRGDGMERRIAAGLQLQDTKMDALIALVGQLQEKIEGPGKIVQAARSPAPGAERRLPSAGHAGHTSKEHPQLQEELLDFDDHSWPEAWQGAAHAMRFFAWGGQSGTVYLRGDPPQAVPQGWMPLASAEFNKDGCVFQRPDGTLAYTREDIVRYYGEFKRKYAGLGTVPVECIDVNSRGNK